MIPPSPNPVVHLELHTGNLARAFGFYSRVCGWRMERIDAAGRSYRMLDWEGRFEGGIVESGTDRALWLPYVEVHHVTSATERARRSGARVLLEPREGPAGWRSVVAPPEGAEIGFWQPKATTALGSHISAGGDAPDRGQSPHGYGGRP